MWRAGQHNIAAVWVAAGVAVLLSVVAQAQTDSPLKGYGNPHNETTDVYVSVYLDRLLKVHDLDFQHETLLYYYITWFDPSAHAAMLESTRRMLDTGVCLMPCTNYADNVACCDGVYRPSFKFRNVQGFSQDRQVSYRIFTPPDGGVVWTVDVHGMFYHSMSFNHFPFDEFDLLVEMEYFSTDEFLELIGANVTSHPGVNVHFSAGGPQLYKIGKGDDTSQWEITGFRLELNKWLDTGAWFRNWSSILSDPNDPKPLAPLNATSCGQYGCEGSNVFDGVRLQLMGIYITVQRFWRYHLLNSVLPICLCAFLGFLIYFVDVTDLASRLQLIVTLFLALTAVQFVMVNWQPTSSYIVPTQQLVITTYVLLALFASGSICVSWIATYPQRTEAAEKRKEGYQRYIAARQAARAGLGGGVGDKSLPTHKDSPRSFTGSGDSGSISAIGGGGGGTQQAVGSAPDPAGWHSCWGLFSCCGQDAQPQSAARRRSRLASVRHAAEDEAYASYLAHIVDLCLGVFLFFGYILAAILIFTLQQGYIDQFE